MDVTYHPFALLSVSTDTPSYGLTSTLQSALSSVAHILCGTSTISSLRASTPHTSPPPHLPAPALLHPQTSPPPAYLDGCL